MGFTQIQRTKIMCSDEDQILFNDLDPVKVLFRIIFKKKKSRKLGEAKKKIFRSKQALKGRTLFF